MKYTKFIILLTHMFFYAGAEEEKLQQQVNSSEPLTMAQPATAQAQPVIDLTMAQPVMNHFSSTKQECQCRIHFNSISNQFELCSRPTEAGSSLCPGHLKTYGENPNCCVVKLTNPYGKQVRRCGIHCGQEEILCQFHIDDPNHRTLKYIAKQMLEIAKKDTGTNLY